MLFPKIFLLSRLTLDSQTITPPQPIMFTQNKPSATTSQAQSIHCDNVYEIESELTGMKYPNVNTLPCSPPHFINSLLSVNNEVRNLQIYFYDNDVDIINKMLFSENLSRSVIANWLTF